MSRNTKFVEALKEYLDSPLPGFSAQSRMAPSPAHYNLQHSTQSKEAAVLVLIYPKKGALHLAYMVRTSRHKEDKHAGQISFPGGKMEDTDNSLLDCALREAQEEVGIQKNNVQVLGQLTQVFVAVSNFMVFPFVAYSSERPDFIKEEAEVQEILEVPLDYLLNEDNHKTKDIPVRHIILKDVPYYDINGKVLWGATAMMTSELMHLVAKIKNSLA